MSKLKLLIDFLSSFHTVCFLNKQLRPDCPMYAHPSRQHCSTLNVTTSK